MTMSLVCQMCMDFLRQYSNEIQDFDGELQVLWQQMQKHVQILDPLLSFTISFQTCKVHNMLAMLQGFGGVHLICWQGEGFSNYKWVRHTCIVPILYLYIQVLKPNWGEWKGF